MARISATVPRAMILPLRMMLMVSHISCATSSVCVLIRMPTPRWLIFLKTSLIRRAPRGSKAARASRAFGLGRVAVPIPAEGAGGGFNRPGNHPQRRGLAGAVGPRNAVVSPGLPVGAAPETRRELAVRLDEIVNRNRH